MIKKKSNDKEEKLSEEMTQKRQQKSERILNEKWKLSTEKHSGVKLSKKSCEEVRADNEELVVARIAIKWFRCAWKTSLRHNTFR